MTYRCQRCDFKTEVNDEADAHMRETGHKRCVVCTRSLRLDETLTCMKCVARTRADLADIEYAYAMLDDVLETAGFHQTDLPGGIALVLATDGSLQSPQTPNMYTEPLIVAPTAHLERPEILGHEEPVKWWKIDRATGIRHKEIYTATTTHPEFIEERIPSDGREHMRDHWDSDPTPVIAVLEAWERDWRVTFEHRAASDELATVIGCVGYLNKWLDRAAREHLMFDEFASDINDLRGTLTHVAGVANDPIVAEASCFDCAGALVRPYRLPVLPQPEMTVRKGIEREGATDVWECRRCRREYEPAEYMLAVRAVLESRALAK